MKNNILYRFLSALAPSKWGILALVYCLAISACELEEPYGNSENFNGFIEFVARPTSYNKQNVVTKAGADAIEDAIYNAFLLIFDSNGQRILVKEVTDFTTTPSTTIPIDKGLSKVTACYLINVPHSFAKGITKLEMPEGATEEFIAENYNSYLNTAVLEGIKYKTGTPMGVPMVDVDNSTSTPDVACIPMFGKEVVDLHNESGAKQINVQRLFAKVTVNLTMNLDLDGWTQELVQTGTYYQLNSYTLYNLPNKVKLTQTTELNSSWIRDPNSFEYIGTSEKPGNGSGILNTKIYNNKYVSDNTEIEFSFYAPEYFLDSGLTEGNQKLKPTYSPSGSYPIYLTLNGTYCQYSVTSAQMYHKVYFGRNETYDFTIERNKNYINYLTIAGTNCNEDGEGDNLDHRVSTEYINNPVAENGVSANCYIIGQAGDYAFPAYKGAYNDLTQAVLCDGSAESTLEEIANDNSSNIQLTKLKYDADKNIVSFTISKISDGNVVIALKNPDGSTEWSWHLWCKSGSRLDIFGWGAMSTQTYLNGAVLMDRNLGANPTTAQLATPGLATGLYYKYGCKEPYFDGSYKAYKGGGILYDNNGDEVTPIWSSIKSPTDPCPPGYKVPNTSVWQNSDSNKDTELGGFLLYRSETTSAYYPYSNYLLADGSLNTNTIGAVPFYEGYSFETSGTYGQAPLDLGILGSSYKLDALCKNLFTLTDMDIQTMKEEGRLWCNNGYICYDHNTLDIGAVFDGGISSLRQKLLINEYIHERTVVKKYKPEVSLSELRKILKLLQSGQITESMLEPWIDEWSGYKPVNPPAMSDDDKNILLGRLILLERNNINVTAYKAVTTSINKTEGYQVRCEVDSQ
jgi:hypothetical protein